MPLCYKTILSRCDSNYKHANPPNEQFGMIAHRVLHQCKSKREILVNCSQMRQGRTLETEKELRLAVSCLERRSGFRCGRNALRFNRSGTCGKIMASRKIFLKYFS